MSLLDYYNPLDRGKRATPGYVDRSPVVFMSCLALGVFIMAASGVVGERSAFLAGTAFATGLTLGGFVIALVAGVRRRR